MARLESSPVDFLLDANDDLVIKNGDVVFSTGLPAVVQEIKIKLRKIKGEDFANLDSGIDYYGEVLGKTSNQRVQTIFTEALLAIPSVTGIKSVSVTLDAATRKRKVEFEVNTIFGAAASALELS